MGVKLAMAAGASLLLLVPAFNSLNHVTVQDVRPPLTLDDPPNVPPPELGDDQQVNVETEEGPSPSSPDCPPPEIVPATDPRYVWQFPSIPQRYEKSFPVEPGVLGIGVNYNVDSFVGHLVIGLVDPQEQVIVVHEFSSVNSNTPEDPQYEDNVVNATYEILGAVPGTWTLFVDVGAPEPQQGDLTLGPFGNPATGHVDAQAFKAYACGGAGRPQAASSARGGL